MKAETLELLRQAEAEREREKRREGWTEVLAALLEAHRMLSFVERRVGPARLRSGYPDFQRVEREGDRAPDKTPGRVEPEYATRIDFDRMEQILFGWKDADGIAHPAWQVMVLEGAPAVHDKFEAWIKARLRRETISAMCRRKGWALRTLEWNRDKAAATIAVRLNRVGVPVW
jgi:hypothetical protein